MGLLFKLLVISFFLVSCSETEPEAPNSTSVYLGGVIYTGVDEIPTAGAVVVTGNRISFVGSEESALALLGESGEIIDLNGAFMFPGFTDGLKLDGRREPGELVRAADVAQ